MKCFSKQYPSGMTRQVKPYAADNLDWPLTMETLREDLEVDDTIKVRAIERVPSTQVGFMMVMTDKRDKWLEMTAGEFILLTTRLKENPEYFNELFGS